MPRIAQNPYDVNGPSGAAAMAVTGSPVPVEDAELQRHRRYARNLTTGGHNVRQCAGVRRRRATSVVATGRHDQQPDEHERSADRSGVHWHLPSLFTALRSGEIAPATRGVPPRRRHGLPAHDPVCASVAAALTRVQSFGCVTASQPHTRSPRLGQGTDPGTHVPARSATAHVGSRGTQTAPVPQGNPAMPPHACAASAHPVSARFAAMMISLIALVPNRWTLPRRLSVPRTRGLQQ
jgi:hypothetical protein